MFVYFWKLYLLSGKCWRQSPCWQCCWSFSQPCLPSLCPNSTLHAPAQCRATETVGSSWYGQLYTWSHVHTASSWTQVSFRFRFYFTTTQTKGFSENFDKKILKKECSSNDFIHMIWINICTRYLINFKSQCCPAPLVLLTFLSCI